MGRSGPTLWKTGQLTCSMGLEYRELLVHASKATTVPNIEAGCCLGPEGNGVSWGEGGEGGPSPLRGGKDKQSVLSVGGDNMGKDKEDQTSRK
jgi:hypothetical protein